MKRNLILGLMLIGSFSIFAQKPIFATAKLNNALVYLRGADLSHSVSVNLKKGSNEIIVKNVAVQLDENSIRIGTNKPVTVMAATFTNNYYSEFEIDENSVAFKKIKDSIALINKELTGVKNRIDSDRQTIQMLDKNQSVGGANTGVSLIELTKLVDYYRQKRLDLSNSISQLSDKQTQLNETLNRLQNQLTYTESNSEKIASGKIVLQIMSEVEQTVRLDVSYISQLASWTPAYEIESKGLSQSILLTSKAKVKQTTGLDWKNVHLTLSSNQPNPNNAIPYYSVWNLSVAQPRPQYNYYGRAALSVQQSAKEKKAESMNDGEVYSNSSADYTSVTSQTLSVHYDISLPYDIYSNGKDHAVTLSKQDIPATYSYYTAPKLSTDAYLIAYMTDYSKYNLLAGEANVLLEGTFVGKTYLNPNSTNDTLEIALGVDKNVVVKREKIAEKSGNKIVTGNKESSYTYEISIRNNKAIATTIEVKDQFPVSTNKDIVVELTQSDNAVIDAEQGLLTWKINLKSQDSKKLRFGYKVKYPKNIQIYNL